VLPDRSVLHLLSRGFRPYTQLWPSRQPDVLPLSCSVLVDRCDTETPDRISVPCSVVHNEHECGHARPEIWVAAIRHIEEQPALWLA